MSSFRVAAPSNTPQIITPADGALLKYVQKNGRTPPVSLEIYGLENLDEPPTKIDKFMSYNFKSSVIAPVESFTCEAYYNRQAADDLGLLKPQEGDIFVLRANGIPISTGIVDQLDMETDSRMSTKITINGRNLLGQWEDQDSVSVDQKIVFANKATVVQWINALSQNTRINPDTIILRDAPSMPYLAATQPGESKLSSMQRYCEALDIWFWMSGDGRIIVGRPDMYGLRSSDATIGPAPFTFSNPTTNNKGTFYCLRSAKRSNVLTIRSTRASTRIPNKILPVWNGQEIAIGQSLPQSVLQNNADGPRRLLNNNHIVAKAVVVSTPEGASAQDLADVNAFLIAKQNTDQQSFKAAQNTIIQAYAKREMARANIDELKVTINIPGHFNDRAEPIIVDQVYGIQYEDDDINRNMYLYEVEYIMDESSGPHTQLNFCNQGAIVSDVRAI